MNESEQKWIETNNQVCGLLRLAHDVLACSSLPPRRTWVGLTDEEIKDIVRNMPYEPDQDDIRAIEAKLKEKNT
jgi:hypothetical protein